MKNCPVCGFSIDDNQGICPNCGSVITDDMNQDFSDLGEEFDINAYMDYLSDTNESKSEEKVEAKPVEEEKPVEETVPEAEVKPVEKVEEAVQEPVEEEKAEEPVFEIDSAFSFDSDDDDEPEEEEEKTEEKVEEESNDIFSFEPAPRQIEEEPVEEEKAEETVEEAKETVEEVKEEIEEEEEDEVPSFRIITDKPSGESEETVVKAEEPVFEIEKPLFEIEKEVEEVKEETEEEPVFEDISSETRAPETDEPEIVFENDEESVGETEILSFNEDIKNETEPVFETADVFDVIPENEETETVSEEVKDEEPVFTVDNSFSFEAADDDADDTDDDIDNVSEPENSFSVEAEEDSPLPEAPQGEFTSSDYLTMTERIRKYQIIPDSQPIDEEDGKSGKALRSKQPVIKMEKNVVTGKSHKGLGKVIVLIAAVLVVAVLAVVLLKNDSLRSKLSSAFNKTPTEKTETVGNVTLKWVHGKKYSSNFDVLKIDKDELKELIEKSLKENCTSEYDSLKEHYFGTVNGMDNYVGYIDNVGVGIIFELAGSDNLIKSIYVIADTSEDISKGETLICEYAVCVLHALGEIKDLSYKNIGVYASSIKLNNFKSIATYSRYNNFVLEKYLQDNNSAIIINHGDESTIKKFAKTEVLDLVNCADEQFLTEPVTETTTKKEEEVSEYEETVVYEIKTAGDPLRIRKEPSTDSEVVGSFENGTQVEVFAIADGWAKIMYNNEEAWLSAKFIEKVEE